MENKPYHHGELRKTLIETGIEFINQCEQCGTLCTF